MQHADHTWYSPSLRQDMTLRVYGHGGRPIIVFPSQEGSFREYQDFGMVTAIARFIDDGRIQLICIDSVDTQSWCHPTLPPHERALRANEYDRYVLEEVLPFALERGGGILLTGASMGGYHAANFYFRHPEQIDGFIALSGVYDLTLFIGDAMDDEIFYHVPLAYLPGLDDERFLERFRKGRLVLCVGQGDWEEPMLTQTRQMGEILARKKISAWIEVWGADVSHDWPWWQRQMPYILERVL